MRLLCVGILRLFLQTSVMQKGEKYSPRRHGSIDEPRVGKPGADDTVYRARSGN